MPTLRKLKDERRVRYIGAPTSRDARGPLPDAAMRRRMEEHWDSRAI